MKYIKQFEKKDTIWLVRTDEPYFSASLDKLGIKMGKEVKKNIQNNYNEIYIKIGTKRQTWGWSDIYEIFNKNYSKNMGKLELTNKEIDDFLIKQNMNKYNL